MILLDPDLDPDPAPQTKPAKTVAPAPLSTRSLTLFLHKAKIAVRLPGQVSVLLTTDAAIRKLNRQFRGKNKATDVLSFPAEPMPGLKRSDQIAGDLAISVDTARKQAAAFGHPLGTELKILILHGLLHLAGFDHEADSGEMARRENALRAKLGLPLGLIERASTGQPVNPKRGHTAGASRRKAKTIAQGGVRRGGRNPGKAPESRARRPVGPARKSLPTLAAKDAARMGHPAPSKHQRRKP
jgi:probable rRNA maturation factor